MSPSTNARPLLTTVTTTQNSAARLTTVASRSGRCAMVMMTAGTTVMSKAVNRCRAILLGISGVRITTASLSAGSVTALTTVEITRMRKTAFLGSAQRASFDVLISNAFPLDGSVTKKMTVETTQMNGTVR